MGRFFIGSKYRSTIVYMKYVNEDASWFVQWFGVCGLGWFICFRMVYSLLS